MRFAVPRCWKQFYPYVGTFAQSGGDPCVIADSAVGSSQV